MLKNSTIEVLTPQTRKIWNFQVIIKLTRHKGLLHLKVVHIWIKTRERKNKKKPGRRRGQNFCPLSKDLNENTQNLRCPHKPPGEDFLKIALFFGYFQFLLGFKCIFSTSFFCGDPPPRLAPQTSDLIAWVLNTFQTVSKFRAQIFWPLSF